MKAVDLYLRPLSDFHTGTQPYIEQKAENVEAIEVTTPGIDIRQQSKIQLRTIDGVKETTVPHADRHWWGLITNDWFQQLSKPLRHHGDISDFVTALNICTDAPVVFSQSPGRIVSGYHEVNERGEFDYNGGLSTGGVGITSAFTPEIPKRVSVNERVSDIYQGVRNVRESETSSNAQSDLMVALHMYDDALTGTWWTSLTNLFYVCENALCSGYRTNPKKRIAEETNLDFNDAESWANVVNRLKHPDKKDDSGTPPKTLLEMVEDGATIPTLAKLRRAANTALTSCDW